MVGTGRRYFLRRFMCGAASTGNGMFPLYKCGVVVGVTHVNTARTLWYTPCTLCRYHKMPTVVSFLLDALPSNLQQEFHTDENKVNLSYLWGVSSSRLALSGGNSGGNDCAHHGVENATIKVLPTWVHVVAWRCAACGCQWAARPADRTDPQVSAFYGCPRCTTATTKVSSSTPSGRRLAEAFPLIAAQWDSCRNNVISNKVLFESVADVPLPCSTVAWWSCPHCGEAWRESVNSRVQRFLQRQTNEATEEGGSNSASTYIPLCSSCESRGVMVSPPRVSDGGSKGKLRNLHRGYEKSNRGCELMRFLRDDPLLLAEAQLQTHDDPGAIALRSDKLLCWRCRRCTYEFVASVSDRFLRYKRCPQCTGEKRTPLNLLSIQRPDALREVARTVSKGKLIKMTVHDDTVLPFVCRTCLSVYRMSVRLRCLLPEGVTPCSKCMWNRVKFAKEAVDVEGCGRGITPRPLAKKKRGLESYAVVENELHLHDKDLMN